MVNCVTSCSIFTDCNRTQQRQYKFYDIRQCYIDKLGQAIYESDWSSVTDCLNVTEAYSAFFTHFALLGRAKYT